MRKMNFLKTALGVAFAMLLSTGLQAQVPDANYERYDSDVLNPDTVDYVTFKTGGTEMGYYAIPDPVYHPNYMTTSALTAGFSWIWTLPAGVTNTTGAGAPANYVELTYGAVGNYTVNVAEKAPDAMGGCQDASPTVLRVNVIAAPTSTLSINPGATWQEIIAGQSYQICSSQAAQTVTLNFVEAVPASMASYSFEVTEQIELLNGAGGAVAGVNNQVETVIQDFPLNNKLKTSNVGTLTGAAFAETAPGSGNYRFTFTSDALNILASGSPATGPNVRTRYTYRVRRSGGNATDTDFLSNISQKSDYLLGVGNENYYAFTNNTVSFTINPAPSTGAIYYIPNNYNY